VDGKHIVFPNLPERLAGLEEFAENLWWSWHPPARMLFKMLNRQLWKETRHNPDKLLKEIPAGMLESAGRDPEYLRHYDLVLSQFRKSIEKGRCDLLPGPSNGKRPGIAYFSAEYGLHHSLPFYAGGLGFLAGDFLKECSDLGIPLVGVGFMYPRGYVHQHIRNDGWQEETDEVLDRDAASISRVLDNDGRQLVVRMPLIDPSIHAAVWRIDVGNIPLYLLDTDIDENDPWNRLISARLYGGNIEQRLRQEIVLGIGGSRILDALGADCAVIHLNEGHAAFAILERLRNCIGKGMSFEEAVERAKAITVFTTHTPAPAGHDIIPFYLMEKYFSSYWPSLGLDRDTFLRLGIHHDEPEAGFNLTAFALRLSGHRNGVSKRHGEVARRMWKGLWPEVPEEEVPIGHITNGVHVPTWVEPRLERIFDAYLGATWREDHDNPYLWELVEEIPDEELWKAHYWLKIKLIDAIRALARQRWAENSVSSSVVMAGGTLLDPSVLTVGFARRFATYKRADLVLFDRARLKRFLNDRWRPVQIIFAGKAHPDDDPAKRILQRVFQAACNPEFGGRIAFVEDYDEQLAQYMVHGVDLWLNNPLPPMEASGTSGMKAALNGVPQLSIMDGWWVEGYTGDNGWSFGGETAAESHSGADADAIYDILENEVIPLYYLVEDDGIPHGWVRIMKNAIKRSAHAFSARRMVKEYITKCYTQAFSSLDSSEG
jgi:starch phosphorylase